MNTVLKYIVSIILLLSFISCSEDLVDTVKTGTLSGKVVKKGTNEALANVKIYTSPTTKTVFTATDGTFTIKDIPIGDYSVKAELQGYLDNLRKKVFADLIIRNGGEFVGLEVSNKRGNLCCLFPDPQYPGHYRLSFHDQAGPVSHLVYSTAEQALKGAISLGYREHTPGQLDRLSEDPHWQFGLARVSETYSALRR